MRTIAMIGACVAVLTTTGCGGTSSPNEDPPTTTTQPPPAPETSVDEPSAQQWPMPDLGGMVLQDAQDHIQALTGGAVYFTDSHDLSGRDRNQVLDANWKVCTQNIEPGAAVTPTSLIDIGVVKVDETCP